MHPFEFPEQERQVVPDWYVPTGQAHEVPLGSRGLGQEKQAVASQLKHGEEHVTATTQTLARFLTYPEAQVIQSLTLLHMSQLLIQEEQVVVAAFQN